MHEWELPIWAAWAGEKTFRQVGRHEHIEVQNVCISRDGHNAEFDVMFSKEKNTVNIPLSEVDALIRQLQNAAKEMRRKQRVNNAGPLDPMLELYEMAQSPVTSEVFLHAAKTELLFLHKFEEQAPVAIKMRPSTLKILRAKTNAALARLAN